MNSMNRPWVSGFYLESYATPLCSSLGKVALESTIEDRVQCTKWHLPTGNIDRDDFQPLHHLEGGGLGAWFCLVGCVFPPFL